MASSDMDYIVLGLGGPRPGVDVLALADEDHQQLAQLPEGQSIYAVDLHTNSGRIAYGTRTGTVCATTWLPDDRNDQPLCQWLQGSPILAVCWVEDSVLCSADTAGQCLLWNVADSDHPEPLATEGKIICSLQRLPNGELVGLSDEGSLLFWSTSAKRLIRCIQGAAPPDKLSLVHLRFWQQERLLVYPAQDGRLCVLPPDGTEVQYVHAHQGPFYVIMSTREGLITIGEEERVVRLWEHLPGNPMHEVVIPWPRPIVGGWPVGHQIGSMLLIDREGKAAIFRYAEGTMHFLRQLPGTNYRTVAGLAPEELERCHDTRRVTRASWLQSQAKEEVSCGRPGNLKTLADEMASLGFERMSLGVRAQQARLENRLLDELRIRKELLNLLGHERGSEDSIQRYVLLLKTHWQLSEAQSIHRAHWGLPHDDRWLADAAEMMANGHSVVEPDISLSLIVGAAAVLGTNLSGKWIVASSEAMNLPPQCSLEAFLEKYEKVRNSDMVQETTSCATRQTVWWISRGCIEQVVLVDLAASSDVAEGRVCSALRFNEGNGSGSLTPILLLDGDKSGASSSYAVSNSKLMSFLDVTRTPQGTSTQQWEVQRLVTLALRRLWTEFLWRRNQGKELDCEH